MNLVTYRGSNRLSEATLKFTACSCQYGCETWSLTLTEEYTQSVFEKRVLRKIIGPTRDEVEWEWRKLHNEEHCDFTPRQIHIIPIIPVLFW